MSMSCRLRLCRLACAAIALTGLWSILPAGSPPARAQAAPPQDATQEMSEDELRLRVELLQRSMGFGGIFGPALQDWLNAPAAPPAAADSCGHYAEYAARQACGAGDLWAADRIEQDRSSPSERDWYNR